MITGRFVRNAWYVAGWSQDLGKDQLLARTILNQPVVLYRKADGGVAALEDRCAHRFAPLSAGRLVGDDRVQCLYHGLEFDPAGNCAKNPHGGNISSRCRVKCYPVIEKHKAMWIWMGDKPAGPAKIPNFRVLDDYPPLHGTKLDHITIKANYELVVDNLLDLSHTAFLHEGILGNADTAESDITIEQDGDDVIAGRHATNVDAPGMWALQWPDHPPLVDKFSRIRWMAPSCLMLFVGICPIGQPYESGSGYNAIHMLTPETDNTTLYHFTAVRHGVKTTDEALNRDIQDKIGKMRRFAFEEQDAPFIEAQQRILDMSPVPLDPVILPIDVGPVRYKRILMKMLAAEST
jgi:vanillate O-demethylase monooxygenase subunit